MRCRATRLGEILQEAKHGRHRNDYTIGYTDPNDGNYFIKGNKLVGLDKDPSFRDGKGNDTQFRAPELFRHLGGRSFSFSRAEMEHMAAAADKIADKLDRQGKSKDANGVRQRGAVLRETLRLHGDRPTLGQLEDTGAGVQASKSFFTRLVGGFGDDRMRIAAMKYRSELAIAKPLMIAWRQSNFADGSPGELMATAEVVGDRLFFAGPEVEQFKWFLSCYEKQWWLWNDETYPTARQLLEYVLDPKVTTQARDGQLKRVN
jgi:hypothetical protein